MLKPKLPLAMSALALGFAGFAHETRESETGKPASSHSAQDA